MPTETNSDVVSTPIDYLSLLPNELLEDIFDYAYSSSPPPILPLSKRLLPFHQKHLNRQISLSFSSQVDTFLTSISNRKEIGALVNSLELARKHGRSITSFDILEKLFPLLPNLQHLDLDASEVEYSRRIQLLFSKLSNVTSVYTKPLLDSDGYPDLNSLAFLSALPSLEKLKVSSWTPTSFSLEFEDYKLPKVRSLAVEGDGAEDSEALQQLPQLRKIHLRGGSISPVGFLTLLSGPDRLVHLETIVLDFDICGKSLGPQGGTEFDEAPLQVDQLRQLIDVAAANGVQIEGTIHEALEILEDYWIEKRNRAILLAYGGNDDRFELLQEVRSDAADSGIHLHILDIISLDPTRLELVRIDQPGRDWSMFSLRTTA
ncbi:hypothetical protein JCM3765_000614 [Sporobolomyces pararoseus]